MAVDQAQQEYRALQAAGWLAAYFGHGETVRECRERFAARGVDDDQSALGVIVWMLRHHGVLEADQTSLPIADS